jgi:hypothetical protein
MMGDHSIGVPPMFRFLLAFCITAAATVPVAAEVIVVNGKASPDVRIVRGAPDRCADGPLIIRLKDASSQRSVRCAAPNPVTASNVTITNTIAIVVERDHKRRYMRRH